MQFGGSYPDSCGVAYPYGNLVDRYKLSAVYASTGRSVPFSKAFFLKRFAGAPHRTATCIILKLGCRLGYVLFYCG